MDYRRINKKNTMYLIVNNILICFWVKWNLVNLISTFLVITLIRQFFFTVRILHLLNYYLFGFNTFRCLYFNHINTGIKIT